MSASSSKFPYVTIRVTIRQPSTDKEQELKLDAMIDTGFDGGVVIPRSLLNPSLEPVRYLPWLLADDSEILLPVFAGVVQIGDFPPLKTVVMPLGDEPLLGRRVIDNYKVIFDHGIELTVEQ